jgi:heavy metal sensor kinase
MRTRSIRFTLTAWYTAILAVMMCAFGTAMFLTMRHTIISAADRDLAARMDDMGPFVVGRLHGKHADELAHEFETHLAGLAPGGEMVQVAGADRHWIYQSASMIGYHVVLPPTVELLRPHLETISTGSVRLRLLSSTVRADGQSYLVQLAQPLDPYYEMVDRFRQIGLWFLPFVFAVSWLGGYVLCRRALAPVDEITDAARSISAEHLNLRLPVPETHDELERLSETMNAMIERLDKAFTRVSEFTADAAHELRTPLSLILTTAELSLREGGSEGAHGGALQQIYVEAVRTKHLIDDLMTLARADSADGRLSFSNVDLREAIRIACGRGEFLAELKQIEFTTNISASTLPVRGEALSLQRLFLILIDNAVKFTPAHGTVSVSATQQDGVAVCEVTDSGPGVPEWARRRIFDRFYRVDPARSHDVGGAGLGLAIARWIADEHHAILEVDEAARGGALFRVRIPTVQDGVISSEKSTNDLADIVVRST